MDGYRYATPELQYLIMNVMGLGILMIQRLPVVVVIGAGWSTPTRSIGQQLQRLFCTGKDHYIKGVHVVGMSVDNEPHDYRIFRDDIMQWATATMHFDNHEWGIDLMDNLGLTNIPCVVVLSMISNKLAVMEMDGTCNMVGYIQKCLDREDDEGCRRCLLKRP